MQNIKESLEVVAEQIEALRAKQRALQQEAIVAIAQNPRLVEEFLFHNPAVVVKILRHL